MQLGSFSSRINFGSETRIPHFHKILPSLIGRRHLYQAFALLKFLKYQIPCYLFQGPYHPTFRMEQSSKAADSYPVHKMEPSHEKHLGAISFWALLPKVAHINQSWKGWFLKNLRTLSCIILGIVEVSLKNNGLQILIIIDLSKQT